MIDSAVVGKSSFRGTRTSDLSVFLEDRLSMHGKSVLLRMEVFNLFNHANILGRQGVYGNTDTPNANFGLVNAGLANIDPARMFQFLVRYDF